MFKDSSIVIEVTKIHFIIFLILNLGRKKHRNKAGKIDQQNRNQVGVEQKKQQFFMHKIFIRGKHFCFVFFCYGNCLLKNGVCLDNLNYYTTD